MAKPRKQTYTMYMYLKKIMDKDIRSDADVQRLAGQWDNEMVNELVVTVLTDNYIPPVILGEESNSQLWVIDGLQRSTSLMLFRYGNYKITSSVEDSVIPYMVKARDDKGNIIEDDCGNIVWTEKRFDVRNHSYEELPDELKKRFNEYQIEMVIHEECDMQRISRLIKRYNNHTSMNTTQKAFTYIDNFARDIRGITDMDFFNKYGIYRERERTKGVLERVVLESVMCMFHIDNWNKQTRQICKYLNANSCKDEFLHLKANIERIEAVLNADIKDMFTAKDTFLWFTLFDKFSYKGIPDIRFAEFISEFKSGLRYKKVDGRLFDDADKNKGTKDKSVIIDKLYILEALMNDYLDDNTEYTESMKVLDFVKETVDGYIIEEDVEQYSEVLDDLTLNVDNSSRLLERQNRLSLIALVAYSFKNDVDLDDWIISFFDKHRSYNSNQMENYMSMKNDVDRYFSIAV